MVTLIERAYCSKMAQICMWNLIMRCDAPPKTVTRILCDYCSKMAQMCTQNVIVHCDTPPKETPLRWSVARRHADVVRVLLAHGAIPTPEALNLLAEHGENWALLSEGAC